MAIVFLDSTLSGIAVGDRNSVPAVATITERMILLLDIDGMLAGDEGVARRSPRCRPRAEVITIQPLLAQLLIQQKARFLLCTIGGECAGPDTFRRCAKYSADSPR
jgi:hypothetical protein